MPFFHDPQQDGFLLFRDPSAGFVGNAAPQITGNDTHNVNENAAFQYDYTITGLDGNTPTLSGPDAGLFTLTDQGSDVWRLAMPAQDFESPADADTDNNYQVTIEADDTVNPVESLGVTVTVVDADEVAPTLQSAVVVSAGNQIVLTFDEQVFGDPEDFETGLVLALSGGPVTATYSVGGGLAPVTYSLSRVIGLSETGTLSYTQPGTGERVNDGDGNAWQSVPEFDITNNSTVDNESPTDIALSNDTILNNAGVNAVVGILSATDPDSESHTFTLVAGAGDGDNASFNINGDELRCNDPVALGAGSYSVRIQADDGSTAPYAEAFALTVEAFNAAPQITGNATHNVNENAAFQYDYTITGLDGNSPTLSGPDAGLFSLTDQGSDVWRLAMPAQDFESPADADTDNNYQVTIEADDTVNPVESLGITVTVGDVDDIAPTLSAPTASVDGGDVNASVSTDEGNGTLYALLSANASENGATVKASGGSQAVIGAGVQNVQFSDQAAGDYYVHFVHTDAAGNDSGVATSSQVTVQDPYIMSVNGGNPIAAGATFNIAMHRAGGVEGVARLFRNNTQYPLAVNSWTDGLINVTAPLYMPTANDYQLQVKFD